MLCAPDTLGLLNGELSQPNNMAFIRRDIKFNNRLPSSSDITDTLAAGDVYKMRSPPGVKTTISCDGRPS